MNRHVPAGELPSGRAVPKARVLCKRNQPADVTAAEAEEDASGLMGRYMPRPSRREDLHVCMEMDDNDVQAAVDTTAAKLNELLNTTPLAWRRIVPATKGDEQ